MVKFIVYESTTYMSLILKQH